MLKKELLKNLKDTDEEKTYTVSQKDIFELVFVFCDILMKSYENYSDKYTDEQMGKHLYDLFESYLNVKFE